MKAAFALLVLALLSAPAAASAPERELTVREIVDRANKALRGNTSHARLTMDIVTPSWERRLDVEGWNRDRELAFILIHAPPKEQGTVTLRRRNEMWLWLPRVERVVKVPPSMMHNSWQGSDFTYEDIVKADSIVQDYTHRLLERTPEDGRIVYKIQADPKPEAPVVWGKVLFWAAVYPGDEVVGLKEEDYSERGELVRTITLSDIKRMGGRLVPARLECRPWRKPGQKTTLQYRDIEFDLPLETSFFSLSRLQRGVR